MTSPFKKVTVVGAGIMGAGIAAHLANAGVAVHLLDIVPEGAADRNVLAKSAIARMLKATPATDPLNAGFMAPENANLITPGNSEDDLDRAVEASDWVIEVIPEKLDWKQALYARIETARRPDCVVSSNTSSIPLAKLVEGRSESFRRHFMITHFFNPPRFMRLLELVRGPDTDPALFEKVRMFCERNLGKSTVICKDTPGFIANRIGTFFLFRAIQEATARGMKIEDVDAIFGKPFGFPKSGVFGLVDMVGLQLVPSLMKSLHETLPPTDKFQLLYAEPELINKMIAEGRTGRKADKGGFYFMQREADGGKTMMATDLRTGALRPSVKSRLKPVKAAKKGGPRALLDSETEAGKYAWSVMRDTLLYTISLIPSISDDLSAVDAAMRDGYNWKKGPFELAEQIGLSSIVERLGREGHTPDTLPPLLTRAANEGGFYKTIDGGRKYLRSDFVYVPVLRPQGSLRLSDIKRGHKPLVSGVSASLWDIGHGVTCLEFHSIQNTLDPSILNVINDSILLMTAHPDRYKAMVVYNEAENFSFGANLKLAEMAVKVKWKSAVYALIYSGQAVYRALREAPFPVVGAPRGMAFGGGCEILLHCDAIQAVAETYMGLVEAGVGLIPGWNGCVRYLERVIAAGGPAKGPIPPVRRAFETIAMPQFSVSTSAQDAKNKLWLRPQDGITMNPDFLLADAKAKALKLAASGYAPPQPATFRLPGPTGRAACALGVDGFYLRGEATYHDVVVADMLAEVLSGGDADPADTLSESDMQYLERRGILSLIETKGTQARIAHTMKTGKPLREPRPDKPESPQTLRKNTPRLDLPRHDPDGRPLQGKDRLRLRVLAGITAALYKVMKLVG